MDNTTRAYLRKTIAEALANENDVAAFEMAGLLTQQPELPQLPAATAPLQIVERVGLPVPTKAAQPPLPDHAYARGAHFWAQAIQEYYLPTLEAAEEQNFTTAQFFGWVEASGFPLTAGDWEIKGIRQRHTWKQNAGIGLQQLTDQGVIHRCGLYSQTYSLHPLNASLAPAI